MALAPWVLKVLIRWWLGHSLMPVGLGLMDPIRGLTPLETAVPAKRWGAQAEIAISSTNASPSNRLHQSSGSTNNRPRKGHTDHSKA